MVMVMVMEDAKLLFLASITLSLSFCFSYAGHRRPNSWSIFKSSQHIIDKLVNNMGGSMQPALEQYIHLKGLQCSLAHENCLVVVVVVVVDVVRLE